MRTKRRSIDAVELAVTGAYTTLFAVSAGDDEKASLTVCNQAAANVAVSLWKVPTGGSPGDGNLILNARQLTDKESYVVRELATQTFPPGSTLQANASIATQVTASGERIIFSRAQG